MLVQSKHVGNGIDRDTEIKPLQSISKIGLYVVTANFTNDFRALGYVCLQFSRRLFLINERADLAFPGIEENQISPVPDFGPGKTNYAIG